MDELDAQLGKGWAEKVQAIYAAGGADAEVARALKMTMAYFDRMFQSYSLFEEHISKGRSDARAWFEEVGRKGLIKANGDLNHQLWTTIMRNRYGYKDKEDGDGMSKAPSAMDENELNQKLAEKWKKAVPVIASRNPD